MRTTIRVRYSDGVLVPLESLEMEDGNEFFVEFDDKEFLSKKERRARFKAAAGGWKGTIDAEELKRKIYKSRQPWLYDDEPEK